MAACKNIENGDGLRLNRHLSFAHEASLNLADHAPRVGV